MATKTVRWIAGVGGVVCLVPFGVMGGGPKMAIDTMEVKFDTVYEKNVRFLSHAFTIKNTGDSALRIYQVRPYCGCTSFRRDSVIQPGKAGHIFMELDFSKLSEGPFYVYLKVQTNDPRFPRFRLAFSGVYKYVVRVDPAFIVLPTETNQDTVQTVTLYTGKPDLQVTQVSFVMDNSTAGWLSTIPIRFQFRKTGKKNREGQWTYSLQVYYCSVRGASRYGRFIVATNHPDKRELKISGALHPVK
jgi:hypothetical protein